MNALDVLVADASQARLFRYTAPPAHLALEASLACPAARRHEQDLVSSRPGRVVNRPLGHTVSLASPHSAREAELDRFARRIARLLGARGRSAAAPPVILICGARLLGLVSGHLSIVSRRRVVATLPKDLLQSTHADLTARVSVLATSLTAPLQPPRRRVGSTSHTIRARRHRVSATH
jgi:protein required for attachment to host cells